MQTLIQKVIWLIYTITLACGLSITDLKVTIYFSYKIYEQIAYSYMLLINMHKLCTSEYG